MSTKLDKLVAVITDATIKTIKDGNVKTLEIEKVPEDVLEELTKIAIHCCMNGPVGVDHEATFPHAPNKLIQINKLCPLMTSGPWKQFCLIVAMELQSKHADLIKGSYTLKFNAGLWPFCENVYRKKDKEDQKNKK